MYNIFNWCYPPKGGTLVEGGT